MDFLFEEIPNLSDQECEEIDRNIKTNQKN